jgi:hypothetical protein
MAQLVDTCWGRREINEKPYWHLISEQGFFYNNVRVAKGALLSVSAGIAAEPHIESAQTLYSLYRSSDQKEIVFEKIRQQYYPELPPRLKTLYVFDDYSFVERALNEWFQDEAKIVHECRMLVGNKTHKADTFWLNSNADQWKICAKNYWSGEMSPEPFPEIIVHGALYFPEWQNFPNA